MSAPHTTGATGAELLRPHARAYLWRNRRATAVYVAHRGVNGVLCAHLARAGWLDLITSDRKCAWYAVLAVPVVCADVRGTGGGNIPTGAHIMWQVGDRVTHVDTGDHVGRVTRVGDVYADVAWDRWPLLSPMSHPVGSLRLAPDAGRSSAPAPTAAYQVGDRVTWRDTTSGVALVGVVMCVAHDAVTVRWFSGSAVVASFDSRLAHDVSPAAEICDTAHPGPGPVNKPDAGPRPTTSAHTHPERERT